MNLSGKLLSTNLRRLRSDRGWTQADLAEKTELSLKMVQKLEYGTTNPSLTTLDNLCKAFGVTPAILYATESETAANAKTRDASLPSEGSISEVVRILTALHSAPPLRRNAALYLLTKDEAYLETLRSLPTAAPIALALQKLP